MQGGERWWANIRYSERGDRDEMYGAQASSRIATVASRRPKHIHMQNNFIIQNTYIYTPNPQTHLDPHALLLLKPNLIADNRMPQAETITHIVNQVVTKWSLVVTKWPQSVALPVH